MGALAIIPARGGSKRLPGKNIRPFLGKPLIAWSIEFARQLPDVDIVHVSTDDREIAEIAGQFGAMPEFMRSSDAASDIASSASVVVECLDMFARQGRTFDSIALLQPTTPLREYARWEEAFAAVRDGADSAIGVRAMADHPWHALVRDTSGCVSPVRPAGENDARSQDLPEAVIANGSLYLVTLECFARSGRFLGDKCYGVHCSGEHENIDIDTQSDWLEAEALAKRYFAA